MVVFLILLNTVCYSQNDSTIKHIIAKYSLDSNLVKSWQTNASGCRESILSIDTITSIKNISILDFFILLGKPDHMTNEYGDKVNIKDTVICTYNIYAKCTPTPEKDSYGKQMIVLFINNKLSDVSWTIID